MMLLPPGQSEPPPQVGPDSAGMTFAPAAPAPRMWTGFARTTFSVYRPFATFTVSFGQATSTACWIVLPAYFRDAAGVRAGPGTVSEPVTALVKRHAITRRRCIVPAKNDQIGRPAQRRQERRWEVLAGHLEGRDRRVQRRRVVPVDLAVRGERGGERQDDVRRAHGRDMT